MSARFLDSELSTCLITHCSPNKYMFENLLLLSFIIYNCLSKNQPSSHLVVFHDIPFQNKKPISIWY